MDNLERADRFDDLSRTFAHILRACEIEGQPLSIAQYDCVGDQLALFADRAGLHTRGAFNYDAFLSRCFTYRRALCQGEYSSE